MKSTVRFSGKSGNFLCWCSGALPVLALEQGKGVRVYPTPFSMSFYLHHTLEVSLAYQTFPVVARLLTQHSFFLACGHNLGHFHANMASLLAHPAQVGLEMTERERHRERVCVCTSPSCWDCFFVVR